MKICSLNLQLIDRVEASALKEQVHRHGQVANER